MLALRQIRTPISASMFVQCLVDACQAAKFSAVEAEVAGLLQAQVGSQAISKRGHVWATEWMKTQKKISEDASKLLRDLNQAEPSTLVQRCADQPIEVSAGVVDSSPICGAADFVSRGHHVLQRS